MTRFNLIRLMTIIYLLTPQVGHANFCVDLFKKNAPTTKLTQLKVKSSNEKAKDAAQETVLYTLNEKESTAIKYMLGSFEFTNGGNLNYTFQPLKTKKYKDGTEVIKSLDAHIDGSPTSLRIEEKSVVSKKHVGEYFRDSQSKETAALMGLTKPLVWSARDKRPAGIQYITFTEYGRKVGLKLESNIYAEAKARFREYYQVPTGGLAQHKRYSPSLGDLVFAEIKINSKEGNNPDAFLGVQGGVFKPRIAVNKSIVNELKGIDFSIDGINIGSTLAKINRKVQKLTNKDGKELNAPSKVDSYFHALELLLKHDPYFLSPSLIVSYSRNSYKTETKDGEYQLTVDSNIKTWAPEKSIGFGEMNKYIKKTSNFDFNNGRFIELKSPTQAKVEQSPIYTQLFSHLQTNHMPMFKLGSGKYHHVQPKIKDIEYNSVNTTIASQGMQYWLVKGFSNLPKPPKSKDITELANVEVAIPFQSKSGQDYRVIFKYEPLLTKGHRVAVLDNVKVIDKNGDNVKITNEIDQLISVAKNGPENKIYSLNINNNLIMFTGRIGQLELNNYQKFVKSFYFNPTKSEGNLREPELLTKVNSSTSLKSFNRKMIRSNVLRYISDRFVRWIPVAVTVVSFSYLNNNYALENINTIFNRPIEQVRTATTNSGLINPNTPVILKSGIEKNSNSNINLIAKKTENNSYIFFPTEPIAKLITNNKITIIYPKDKNTEIIYDVHSLPNNGGFYLTISN